MISTSDIYLAAIYIALGAEYSHADKTNVRHQKFIFKDGDLDFEKVRVEYINETLVLNIAAAFRALQRMKSEIHST